MNDLMIGLLITYCLGFLFIVIWSITDDWHYSSFMDAMGFSETKLGFLLSVIAWIGWPVWAIVKIILFIRELPNN